jgi:hypothetical protein
MRLDVVRERSSLYGDFRYGLFLALSRCSSILRLRSDYDSDAILVPLTRTLVTRPRSTSSCPHSTLPPLHIILSTFRIVSTHRCHNVPPLRPIVRVSISTLVYLLENHLIFPHLARTPKQARAILRSLLHLRLQHLGCLHTGAPRIVEPHTFEIKESQAQSYAPLFLILFQPFFFQHS